MFRGRFHEWPRGRPEDAKPTAKATVVRSGNDACHPRSLPATRRDEGEDQGQRVGEEDSKRRRAIHAKGRTAGFRILRRSGLW